jgi:hypothetical protein
MAGAWMPRGRRNVRLPLLPVKVRKNTIKLELTKQRPNEAVFIEGTA